WLNRGARRLRALEDLIDVGGGEFAGDVRVRTRPCCARSRMTAAPSFRRPQPGPELRFSRLSSGWRTFTRHSAQTPWVNVAPVQLAMYVSMRVHLFFSSRMRLQYEQIGRRPSSWRT